MTGLLVSVRSAAEAEIALAGGADLIDVKEPRRGALGAADPEVWEAVQQLVAGRVPTSAALGELADFEPDSLPRLAGLSFAKIGLAGNCRRGAGQLAAAEQHARAGWLPSWRAAIAEFPRGTQPVAVAYSDWQAAHAPALREVLAAAADVGCPYLLLDTFDKSRGNLLAHLPFARLAELSEQVQALEIRLVLAGSLDAAAIEKLWPLMPAYFAVRGAVCRGGRVGTIDVSLVERFAELVHS